MASIPSSWQALAWASTVTIAGGTTAPIELLSAAVHAGAMLEHQVASVPRVPR
jgi:hypothetical protein